MADNNPVALCVTCIVDQIMPEIGVATVRLLRDAGFTVAFPEDQTCCGQPFFNSGFFDQARPLAQRTIEIFEPYAAVVLPSGSCTSMIRVEYPHLLVDDPAWAARARALAEKTFELGEFLTRSGYTPSPGDGGPVTYHDSCHMCRLLHLSAEPRALLTDAGHPITEMDEPDRCCGFGGLFSVRMPEVSNAMTAEKLRQAHAASAAASAAAGVATAAGAATLVTSDPGCLMQMRGLADGIAVEHIATVLAAGLPTEDGA